MKFFASFCLMLALISVCRAEIRVVGSDLFADFFKEPLRIYAESTGQKIRVEMIGTQPALTSFEEGNADLALIAVPGGSPTTDPSLIYIPYAFQIAVIVANRDNPINEISIPQLLGIFGASAETYFLRWGELGLSGIMANRSIQSIVHESSKSVLIELFRYRVLNGGPLKPEILRVRSEIEVAEQIANDPSFIGVLERPSTNPLVKTLSVSSGVTGQFAFDPKTENVFYGDYPIRLPFYVVIRKADVARLTDLVQLIYSDEFMEALRRSGFVSLTENLRKRVLFENLK